MSYSVRLIPTRQPGEAFILGTHESLSQHRAKEIATAHARLGFKVELLWDGIVIDVYQPSRPKGKR